VLLMLHGFIMGRALRHRESATFGEARIAQA
jgi:hypothetical protein